jgi:hypothetical protein
MPIIYEPKFQHEDWIDNIHRVQAGGDNGINIRFHRLEIEFQAIAVVVKNFSDTIDLINAALANLTVKPLPQDLTASFAPALLPTTGTPWTAAIGRIEKTSGQTGAHGWMGISLPDKAVLNSMTVLGKNSGAGILSIGLKRQVPQADAPNPESLLEVNNNGGGVFSAISPPHPANPLDPKFVVDNTHYKYLIIIDLDSALAGDSVLVTNIQISYTVGR